jgi:hypothetical protein
MTNEVAVQGKSAYTPDQVLEAAYKGNSEVLDGFRKDLSNMSKSDQLDFARKLNERSKQSLSGSDDFPYLLEPDGFAKSRVAGAVAVDAVIKNLPDGSQVLADLDVVTAKYQGVSTKDAKRIDLFDSKDGKGIDEAQDLKKKMGPYVAAFDNIVHDKIDDPSIFSKYFWMDPADKQKQAFKEAEATVGKFIVDGTNDPVEGAKRMREFIRQAEGLKGSNTFYDMGPALPGSFPQMEILDKYSSGVAHILESAGSTDTLPDGLKKMYEDIKTKRGFATP